MPDEIIVHVKEEIPQDEKISESQLKSRILDDPLELIHEEQTLLAELNFKEADQKPPSEVMIQMVPKFMRQNKDIKKYFVPREISIGPIHAKNKNLSKVKLKLELAKKFINSSGATADNLLGKIKEKIKEIRTGFGEGVIDPKQYDDDSLARLLFLDGCAVVEFIHSSVAGELEEFKINTTQAAFIQQDLFLFENQIPFQVLKLLMENINAAVSTRVAVKKMFVRFAFLRFILRNNVCAPTDEYDYTSDMDNQIDDLDSIKPVHLLDLLRTVSISGRINEIEDKLPNEEEEAIRHREEFDALLDKEHPTFSDNMPLEAQKMLKIITGKKEDKQSFRNVQELKSSGIKMKPSNSRYLKSVSFGTHCLGFRGHLELPTLVVNDSTVRKLLNLVAYEMYLDDSKKHRVTSYLDFMDLLIDTEQDAKDLRAEQILQNRLSTDAEVAKVFNMIGSSYFSKKPDYYVDVKNKIEEHYKRNCAVWMAQVYNDHFGNPWTIVALLAATIALILTFVQTWYAIYPN